MNVTGDNLIGGVSSRAGRVRLRAVNPATGAALAPEFHEAGDDEIELAAQLAEEAFEGYSSLPAARRAAFLRATADEILALGDELLDRAAAETALPRARLESERARTLGQLSLFADLIEEGSWVDARIDRARPERQPAPRPDLRRMLVPIGPVVVFGASNFPLAFSVAGGDTASALAAGCPVIVKAHPAHPGTSELVARAILAAARAARLPPGVFSLLHGAANHVGQALVTHPLVQAVAFTGSFGGGRMLFEAGALRARPIPVFAEMSSTNPVFVLPEALAQRGEMLAQGLCASVTLGAGQFCTNPGLTVVLRSPATDAFVEAAAQAVRASAPGTTVHAGIKASYDNRLGEIAHLDGVVCAARAAGVGPNPATSAQPALFVTDAESFAEHPELQSEIYGPATVLVRCGSKAEMLDLARGLWGHLTATLHGTDADLAEHAELVAVLRRKAGRLIVNGFPTGVEVCAAMQHGGPYPATTDARSTSVGTAAILRFVRPVCFQGFPAAALPEELRDENPRGLLRLVDGQYTREPL
jgi:NADP-dependent aldehyde dehydrogenase